MTYKEIVDLIRDVAKEVNSNGTFVHGSRSDISIATVDVKGSLIALLPIRTSTNRRDGIDTHEIVMMFFRQDTPTTRPEEREEIINEMNTLVDLFMEELLDRTVQVEAERKTPEYRQLAGTVSGYGLSFNLISKRSC